MLGASALVFAFDALRLIRFPYPVDYGEGPLLDQAVRLSHGETIYRRDLVSPPFTVANYPPLFQLLQAPWVRLAGPALWYGRLLSTLSAIAAAAFLAGILWTLAGDGLGAAVAGLTLLALPYVGYWAALARVDTLALALSLAGAFAVVRRPESRTALGLAGLLLAAAACTRQTYAVAAPLALGAWLAGRPETRRRAWELAACTYGSVAVVFLALSLASGGGFYFHVVTANLNEFRPGLLWLYGAEIVRLLPGLLLAALAFLVTAKRSCPALWRLVACYSAGACLAAFAIGKTGSNVNYLLELCAALSLASGALVHALSGRRIVRVVCLLVLALQASVLLGGTRYREHLRGKLDERPVLERLMEIVRRADGPVLADEQVGLLPLAGKPIHFQPFEMTQLARAGAWDPAPFLRELERGEFAAILIHRPAGSQIHLTRWEPAMLERVERYYAPEGVVGTTVVYRRKPAG